MSKSLKTRTIKDYRPLNVQERIFFYGLLGWSTEIMFTSIFDYVFEGASISLVGYSYLWMFPIWGLGLLLGEQIGLFFKYRLKLGYVRFLIYVLISFGVEYISGLFLHLTIGYCVWDYSNATNYHIHGFIRLDYAPAWFLMGIIGEFLSEILVNKIKILK
eukprot:TRINITY_DN3237_c0_g1_i1.p1 TRINITY_DN3237_c0_g1~~TRINITY_DN3237_c0_g1_i1.p1  ORF type:complete len:160 (-),score=11.40 TRINITY_DN3237_c0_g1_i1:162-641(-)